LCAVFPAPRGKQHTAKTWNTAFQQAIREHGYNRDQITGREIEAHYLTYSNGAWYVNTADRNFDQDSPDDRRSTVYCEEHEGTRKERGEPC
jgi:hypothetical protein